MLTSVYSYPRPEAHEILTKNVWLKGHTGEQSNKKTNFHQLQIQTLATSPFFTANPSGDSKFYPRTISGGGSNTSITPLQVNHFGVILCGLREPFVGSESRRCDGIPIWRLLPCDQAQVTTIYGLLKLDDAEWCFQQGGSAPGGPAEDFAPRGLLFLHAER